MKHGPGFKRREESAERHLAMLDLARRGWPYSRIALRLGVDRTVPYKHLSGRCVCGLEVVRRGYLE